MERKTSVEWFVDGLKQRGVEWIAALCGHGLDPFFDALKRAGIRIVDTRNEQTAGSIAECFGRLTRRPGVCATSSGVAVVNGMTGLLNAWFDHAPMLLVSGSANLTTLGLGCFQDLDQAELARSITRYSKLIDVPSRAAQMLDEAWEMAKSGPVHLMFPMDVQRAEVSSEDLFRPNSIPPSTAAPQPLDLQDAKRPLIIAGSGVYYSGEGADLIAFAERHKIPVQTPIWDRGVFDKPSEAFVGVIGSATGGPDLIGQTDCLILAGVDVDYRLGYLQREVRTLRHDSGWKHFDAPQFPEWLAEARRQRTAYREQIEATAESQRIDGRMHAIDITRALAETLPEDASLVLDGGSIGQWAHQLLTENRYPSHWLTCGRSGVVGYGIGGAMAARLAFPDRAVVLLSGDGAFTFTPADLECAVRNKLPFVAIVADDQCWGITHTGHVKQFGEGIGTLLGAIRFDALAESLGARGRRVERAADLAPALREAMASGEVTVLHVPISGGNPT